MDIPDMFEDTDDFHLALMLTNKIIIVASVSKMLTDEYKAQFDRHGK